MDMMDNLNRTRVELALAIKEQEHKVEMITLEFVETYGRTRKQNTDFKFIITVFGALIFLGFAIIAKVNF